MRLFGAANWWDAQVDARPSPRSPPTPLPASCAATWAAVKERGTNRQVAQTSAPTEVWSPALVALQARRLQHFRFAKAKAGAEHAAWTTSAGRSQAAGVLSGAANATCVPLGKPAEELVDAPRGP